LPRTRRAAANDLVVLYPQVRRTVPLNPKGCFDWWGYTGPDYASQLGVQMHAVRGMLSAVSDSNFLARLVPAADPRK
jgi:hypothetical protein